MNDATRAEYAYPSPRSEQTGRSFYDVLGDNGRGHRRAVQPCKVERTGEPSASVLPALLLGDGARAGTAPYPSEASTSGCWKVPGLTVYRRNGGVLIISLVPVHSFFPHASRFPPITSIALTPLLRREASPSLSSRSFALPALPTAGIALLLFRSRLLIFAPHYLRPFVVQ